MAHTLLQSLRDHAIDESQPLAGLLRKCLLLGAETKSETLRQWARCELHGYAEDVAVPTYRQIPTPMLFMDYVSGYTVAQSQPLNRLELPKAARDAIPESLSLTQSVEELEGLAQQKTFGFTIAGLAYAKYLLNQDTGPFQSVVDLRFKISGSMIAGILGRIRTQLVDLIAELAADTPLSDLPGKDQVDAAVQQHIGTVYNTMIQSASGPTAIGSKAKAISKPQDVADILSLLDGVRVAVEAVDEEHRSKVITALEELRLEASRGAAAQTGDVVKKAGKLRQVAESLGVSSLSAAVAGAVEAVTNLAMMGGFG